jgi:hypothetical protein
MKCLPEPDEKLNIDLMCVVPLNCAVNNYIFIRGGEYLDHVDDLDHLDHEILQRSVQMSQLIIKFHCVKHFCKTYTAYLNVL